MGRVTVDFSAEANKSLEELAKELNSSKADAIRKALALLTLTLQEQKEGSKLVFENKKTKEKKELAIL